MTLNHSNRRSSLEYDGPPNVRPSDSGSWVWEFEYGKPTAQVTWSNGREGMAITLEDIFDEVEKSTGYRSYLP
jgi:hypothetical protein